MGGEKRKATGDAVTVKKKKRFTKKAGKTGHEKSKKKSGGKPFKGKKKQGVKRKRTDEKPNWKELKAEKKQRKQESREKKPHAEAVAALLSVFGANFQGMKKPARYAKVNEIMKKIGDDLKSVINRKGSARAVILLIKHGNSEHRAKIVNSLKPLFLDLCKDGKGHHVVLQMLVYANEATMATICKELIKHVARLSNNRYGSMVLDRVLVTPACKRYKLLILQQLYSKIYSQLPAEDTNGEPLELSQILATSKADKPFIMENMKKYLENMLSKTPSLVVVQMVLRQYLLHCSSADYGIMVDLIIPVATQLFSCPEGCLAVLEAFNFSKAKQRKKLLQAFRENIVQMSMDVHTVKVLLRAIDVTDDTVVLKKIVFSELLANMDDVFTNERSRLLFLHVLSPRSKRYFKKFLEHLPEPITKSQDDTRVNSKKSNESRQTELLKIILTPLVEHMNANIPDLVRKNEPFLYSVLLQCFGTLYPSQDLGESVLVKVAEYCIENMDVFVDATAHRRLRGLVELCPHFASTLVSRLSVDEVQEIARNRGAIVLVRCLQQGSEDIKAKILNSLKPITSELKGIEGKSVQILVEEAKL